MTHEYRMLDVWAAVFAVLAGMGFWQGVALAITIIAGMGSISLVGLRWYVFLKYGPARGRE